MSSPSRAPGRAAIRGLALAISATVLTGTVAVRAQARGVPEPREVLALTDTFGSDRDGAADNHVHELLQMPMNYLGMTVRIRGYDAGQPPPVDPAVTRAVLVHVGDGGTELPDWLLPWLQRQRAGTGVRFVHIGSLDAFARLDTPGLRGWLRGFGLEHRESRIDNPLRVDYEVARADHCAFEAEPALLAHVGPFSRAADNLPWLTTEDRRVPGDARHPVVTGPWGGLALDPWILSYGTGNGDRRWHIDPFAFFRAALGLDDVPAPDPSVTWGRRMFLLHVDGDGFESLSTARAGCTSAEVFGREVVDRFRIPMTLSVIVRSLTDDLRPAAPTPNMELAKRLFATPWVEVASHTVLHPLDWRRRLHPRSLPRSVVWYDSIENFEHSMTAEVVESVRFIDRHLTTPERPCRVVLWSGAANPDAAAIAASDELSCENLNGGVYRWDRANDSVGYVAPWGFRHNGVFQVYCGAANENVFDGFFTTMPTSFGHVRETIENTGAPRILKPANVYAHFYSAENAARLRALVGLIEEWAYERCTVPVHASTWAAAVRGAEERCRLSRADGGWVFDGFDTCRTVRFDRPTGRIDWARSPGVLGCNTVAGRLYVQLAPGRARLTWSDAPAAAPHFVDADHELADASRDALGVRFRSAAWRTRTVTLGGFPPAAALEVRVSGRTRRLDADAAGRVVVRLSGGGDDVVEVRTR